LPGLRSFNVPRLTDDEQRRYLRDVRSIRSKAVVRQIVRLSEGLPFTLALYANLVKQSDTVDAEVLRSFRDPGLLYAIERVLERIDDDQVQWLIRYGVVPRRLSFDFVVSVIAPHLPHSMDGTSGLDDPTRDERPRKRRPTIFRTGVDAPTGADELREVW